MNKRALGSTDMTITTVGLGTFAIGGWMWGPQDDADSAAAIRAALDAGVNWVDTAPIYGSGRADAVLAGVLKDLPAAQRPLVFTKFGHHVIDGQRVNDGSRARVVADCEYALRTFGVERLDLFQMHWPADAQVAETAAACAELVASGKVRAVGLSNHSVAQCAAWIAAGGPLHAVQVPYSVFRPEAADGILPWCAERGIGALAYSALHRGFLFGTWQPGHTFPPGDHRAERDDFRSPRLERYLDAVARIKAIAEADDETCAGLALGCLLCTEGLTACIVSARNAAQGAFLGQLGRPVKADQLEQVTAICDELRRELSAQP